MNTYRVTIKPEGCETTTVEVEATDEWKARTRAMGTALSAGYEFPSGAFVDYDVVEV